KELGVTAPRVMDRGGSDESLTDEAAERLTFIGKVFRCPFLGASRMLKTRLARRVFKGFAVLAVLVVLGVGALWLERRSEITLPTPTGSFAVGRAIYDWADDATVDTLAPVPGIKRELLVWIWYPSATGEATAAMEDYVPAELRLPSGRDGGISIMRLLTRDWSKVHPHSFRNADMSPQQRSYPVVIMRAGASAGVVNYTTLAEDLASHGYVVVGIDAPYRTSVVVFPDGRVMRR